MQTESSQESGRNAQQMPSDDTDFVSKPVSLRERGEEKTAEAGVGTRKFFYYSLLVYILFVCVSLFAVSKVTSDLYNQSYTLIANINEKKARLEAAHEAFPMIYSTHGIKMRDMQKMLSKYEERQDRNIEAIQQIFPVNSPEVMTIREEVANLRYLRRQMFITNPETGDLVRIDERYKDLWNEAYDDLKRNLKILAKSAEEKAESMNNLRELLLLGVVGASLFGGVLLALFFRSISNSERLAYQKLGRRERMFSLLSWNIGEVFILFDARGHVDYVSGNCKRILNLSHHSVKNSVNAIYHLFSPDDVVWFKNFTANSRVGEESEREMFIESLQKTFLIRIYAPKTEEDNLFIVVIIDQTKAIAYKKALNDALEATKKSAEVKNKFFSHMSHEIRTPLNAILGLTELSLNAVGNPRRVETYLRKVLFSSRHLLSLINDILDMSKIESDRLLIAHEDFHLEDCVKGVLNVIEPQAQAKGIQFDVVLRNIEEESLVGDRMRIGQIFINLLSNAVKFTPKGGKVSFIIDQKILSDNKMSLDFTVRDTGIGMSPEFLERMYQPFVQESTGVTSTFGGTGLGLAITKSLVNMMGGSISVTSEVGKGSEFVVHLPFTYQREAAAPLNQTFERCLVVDEVVSGDYAKNVLTKLGLKADCAQDEETAYDMIRRAQDEGKPYEVCFLTWKTPRIQGERLIRNIRRNISSDLPRIVVSAFDSGAIQEKALAAGAQGFIEKPFFSSSFYDALQNLSQGSMGHPSAEEKEEEEKTEFDFSGKRILLAEDNLFNQEVATEFLEMTKVSVEVAKDGVEAVDKFSSSMIGYYDVILMDVQMPNMDGYEATRRIRAMDRSDAATVPIIAMTANAFKEDVLASMQAGMNSHLAKPLEFKQLFALLDKIFTQGAKKAKQGK
jgi:signal transduction histidine kinase/DNA-binding response OmpR family regulator